jgi:large subunit ribosomal protein L25
VSTTRPTLAAAARTEAGKANARLRHAGRVPAVVYGHGPSASISVDAHEFDLLRRRAGANALIDLVIDGDRATPVLLHGVQFDKISRTPLHVDLFRVRMTEDLTVDVPVHGVGLSDVVERHGGTVIHALDHVRVRALPDHLPSVLEADLTALIAYESVIQARDLALPPGVTLATDPDEVVFRVLAPRVSDELAAGEVAPAEGAGEAAPVGATPAE